MTNYLDLFSGIGGFALGAYWAGLRFDNHYFSEVEPYAVSLYQRRFPDSIGLGDITKIDTGSLPPGEWIISGGFPCQDISVVGKGAGMDGARSGLWFTYAEIIGKLRPRFAIMENVGALTFRGLTDVLGSLAEIGYDAEWQDIRASDVGAPHRRERIWIVAYPMFKGLEGTDFVDEFSKNRQQIRKKRATSKVFKQNVSISSWSKIKPGICGMDHGIPSRVDRIKGLGNAIVHQIAEMIFRQSAFDEWREC
jgi:DNA (cytosine-5)-methyltransferase 1